MRNTSQEFYPVESGRVSFVAKMATPERGASFSGGSQTGLMSPIRDLRRQVLNFFVLGGLNPPANGGPRRGEVTRQKKDQRQKSGSLQTLNTAQPGEILARAKYKVEVTCAI